MPWIPTWLASKTEFQNPDGTLQVCEHFVAPIDVHQLGVTDHELKWLLLADGCGAKKLRGKIVADLLPKLHTNMPRLKGDEAWRQLGADTQLLLLEGAFKSFEKEVFVRGKTTEGYYAEGYYVKKSFPSEASLAAWQGFGSLE